jgi:hypothetical protein
MTNRVRFDRFFLLLATTRTMVYVGHEILAKCKHHYTGGVCVYLYVCMCVDSNIKSRSIGAVAACIFRVVEEGGGSVGGHSFCRYAGVSPSTVVLTGIRYVRSIEFLFWRSICNALIVSMHSIYVVIYIVHSKNIIETVK